MDKKRTRAAAKVAALGILVLIISGCTQSVGDKYVEFSKCLTSKNVKMYGAYWCSYCKKQKEALGNGFSHINYIECDPRGPKANPKACADKKIEGFPTWEMPDGTMIPGLAEVETLAEKSGCALPAETTP